MDLNVLLATEEDLGILQSIAAHVLMVKTGMELSASRVLQDLTSMASVASHVIKVRYGIL